MVTFIMNLLEICRFLRNFLVLIQSRHKSGALFVILEYKRSITVNTTLQCLSSTATCFSSTSLHRA